MLADLLLLAVSATAQLTDTITYSDEATRALIVQARGRHAYQDSLIRDYTASVRTRIDVGFGRSRFARIPPIVAHETAAEITWSLPNDLKVDVVGERAASAIPSSDSDMEAQFDRPWFVPRSLGDSIRMLSDELPTTAAIHPLAFGAEEFYRYAITDSVTLSIPGRTVRAVGVRVEPKRLGPSLIAGDMWIDLETVEVVRLTFVFVGQHNWVAPDEETPADSLKARKENVWAQRVVKLEADLEYALYERLYWMPYRQLLQLTVDIPWFLNLKIPVRFLTTFGDYEVNQSVRPSFEVEPDSLLPEEDETGEEWRRRRSRTYFGGRRCDRAGNVEGDSTGTRCNAETGYSRAGPSEQSGRWEIRYPPRDSLQAYDGWPDKLTLDLSSEDEERIKETIAALGELQEELPADWVGRMPHHFAIESFSDVYRFNRVQGSSLGFGYQIRPGPAFTTLHATGRFGFSDRRPTGSIKWRREAPGGRLDIAAYRDVREAESWTGGLGFGNSLNGIFAGHDDADYYLALGGGISFLSNGRGLLRNAEFGLFVERQRSMLTVASSGINDRLGGAGLLPPNTPVLEGDFVRAFARRRSSVGPVELEQAVEGLVGDGVQSARVWGNARLPFQLLGYTGEWSLRAGGLAGDAVPQMLYRLGGVKTIRGYDYAERISDRFWAARLDVALRKSGLLSPVAFADVGDGVFSQSVPLVSVGAGISAIDGFFRLNVAKGLNPSRAVRFDMLFQAPR